MSIYKYVERYKQLDQLIRLKCTGQPKEFAAKIGISESYLYACLNELKDIGLDISYCKYQRTYYYPENKRLKIEFGIEQIPSYQGTDINGGTILVASEDKKMLHQVMLTNT